MGDCTGTGCREIRSRRWPGRRISRMRTSSTGARSTGSGWRRRSIPSIGRGLPGSADCEDGSVRGGGYYVERPSRLECDGVTQPHAADAFRRAAALNRLAGRRRAAERYEDLARRIERNFVEKFWLKDHFAEYLHPQRGLVGNHGLTDADWAPGFRIATPDRVAVLWPRLRHEERFYYGGMPTGISTAPETYEEWEFSYPDRMDLAAMGRVWYLECAARARMGDGEGLVDCIRRVCRAGRDAGYYWRERYGAKGGYGAEKYCEYPANLIRIVQRFLLGVELGWMAC